MGSDVEASEHSPSTKLLGNARIVRAKIKGIVEREPPTGTIPEDEMRLEIVILSVSEVVHVPLNCAPSDAHDDSPSQH